MYERHEYRREERPGPRPGPYDSEAYGERPTDRYVHEERYVDGRMSDPPVVLEPYNYRAVQVAWFVTALISTLIALRFTLKLLGASPQAEFVGFIYGVSAPLVAPFRGIFPDSAQGFFVFEPSSLVAMVIYLLIGWGIVALIKILTSPRRSRPVA
jgi:uncharacterized protein YggT (Ycf19 family)